MLCEKCNAKEAQVHFTEVKNKQKVEIHLCNQCAENHQDYISSPTLSYSVNDLLGGLIQIVTAKNKAEDSKLKCPDCGLDYYEFQNKGRLGCARDYKVFRKRLKDMFIKVHSSATHTGKVPKQLRSEVELSDLKKKMEQLVKEEQYEEAAVIRDQIKALTKENDHDTE